MFEGNYVDGTHLDKLEEVIAEALKKVEAETRAESAEVIKHQRSINQTGVDLVVKLKAQLKTIEAQTVEKAIKAAEQCTDVDRAIDAIRSLIK
jgi:DNA gyrase/topoisomerase IV subunit B